MTGIGGAGELAVGAPYTAEMFPKKYRALGTGGIMFSLYCGVHFRCNMYDVHRPALRLAMGIWLCDHPRYPGFRAPPYRSESFRFKHAQAEIERLVKTEGKRRPRTSIWSIPGAKKRIFIGWLLYVPNACGYWGITVFLTTFMVQKFHVTPVDAIFYAMTFYIVQFFLSYVGTGLSDLVGRRPAGILGALIMMGCTVIASRTEDFNTFLIFGGIMIGMLGWLWGIGDTYLSEFFRTTLRTTGFGIMVGGGRVASIFAPFLVGWGIAEFGPTIPFLATAVLWVGTIIGYWIGPETSGRELEEVQL